MQYDWLIFVSPLFRLLLNSERLLIKGEACTSGKNIKFGGKSSLDKHLLSVYHMPEIVLGSEINGEDRPL